MVILFATLYPKFNCLGSIKLRGLNKISTADVFIISVPTPIDINNNPDLNCLEKATESIGEIIKARKRPSNPVIIYESTVYPGTTEEICVPILEEKSGLKFKLG